MMYPLMALSFTAFGAFCLCGLMACKYRGTERAAPWNVAGTAAFVLWLVAGFAGTLVGWLTPF